VRWTRRSLYETNEELFMISYSNNCNGPGSGDTDPTRRLRLAGGAGLVLCLGLFAGSNVHAAARCTITTDPSPAVIDAGDSVTFTGKVTGKPPYNYGWSFPGGEPASVSPNPEAETVTTVYASGGSYTATLDGSDDRGQECNDSVQVTVNEVDVPNNPPVCTIDTPATDLTITEGDSVNYTSTVTDPDGDTVTIAWVFPGTTLEILDHRISLQLSQIFKQPVLLYQ
jgi:hypothetical protein